MRIKTCTVIWTCWALLVSGTAAAVPTIDLELTDGTATEAGRTTGQFKVKRTDSDLSQSLQVSVAVSGVPTKGGHDYRLSPGLEGSGRHTVTIPENEAFVTVSLTPELDNLVEGAEIAMFDVQPSATESYTIGGDSQAQITIEDDVATVSLEPVDNSATEAGRTTGQFRVIRSNNGKVSESLSARLLLTGTAGAGGIDFRASPGFEGSEHITVSIAANELFRIITLTPEQDNRIEGPETAIYTVGTLEPARYFADDASEVQIVIEDDVAEVSIELLDGIATEAGRTTGSFRVHRTSSGKISESISVDLQTTGAAGKGGIDYRLSPGFETSGHRVAIPAGELFVDVTLTPEFNEAIEGDEDAVITVLPSDNDSFTLGSPTSVTITILDYTEIVFSDSFEQ